MSSIKVIIDGKVADLPPMGLNLPLSYSLKSRDGININTGSRSEYAFELPATKQNDEIFSAFYITGNQTFSKQIFLDAAIEVDGLPFFIGKCQLQSVTLKQDLYIWGGKSYKIAFYGSNSDWVIKLNPLQLRDLPYDDFTYSYANNIGSLDTPYVSADYKTIILKLKDYTTFGQVDGLEDIHPAIYIVALLRKMFNQIGYTVVSNFLDTNFAKRLIMPVPILNKYLQGQYGIDYLNASFYETGVTMVFGGAPIICTNQTTAPIIGSNPYNTVTGLYTAPQDGFYLFKFKANIYNITINGVPDFLYTINSSPSVVLFLSPSLTVGNDITVTYETVVQLSAGDTLTWIQGGLYDAADADYYIDVIGEAEIVENTLLNFRYLLEDWKCMDLIKGLSHAFNLVFETNEAERKVYIEPSDQYLYEERDPNTRTLENGFYNATKDYTQNVDLLKGGELVSETKQSQNFRLKWKEDSNDPTVEALEDLQPMGILQARYVFPNNRFKEGEQVLENPFFAPTLVIADEEIISPTTTDKIPMIPIIWKENYLETSTSSETVDRIVPRILITQASNPNWNGVIRLYNGSSVNEVSCPLNYMVDFNDTTGYQTSLSFGNVNVNGNLITGLMQRFYLSELVRLQSGKYLECFLLWDVLKIQNLTFREKIILSGDIYVLQEINSFNVSKNESTKTYLKYDYREPNAEGNIENTIVIAKINTGGI